LGIRNQIRWLPGVRKQEQWPRTAYVSEREWSRGSIPNSGTGPRRASGRDRHRWRNYSAQRYRSAIIQCTSELPPRRHAASVLSFRRPNPCRQEPSASAAGGKAESAPNQNPAPNPRVGSLLGNFRGNSLGSNSSGGFSGHRTGTLFAAGSDLPNIVIDLEFWDGIAHWNPFKGIAHRCFRLKR